MKETPLISIVLPVYNGSKYLAGSIESCLKQTYTNWELIIVDDCSTDLTPKIIEKYTNRDPRIQSIRHDVNRKLPAALNTGFRKAKGEYFTWTSDDNLDHPQALETMVTFMVEHKDIDVVYTDYTIIDEAGSKIREQIVEEPDVLVYRSCIGACFMYKSKVHYVLDGFNEDLFLVEDYDFWLRASRSFKMKPLHKNLYFYRRHSASLTDQYNEKIFLLTRKVMAKHEALDFRVNFDDIKLRPLLIWGTGNGGKFTYKSLVQAGFTIDGFVDSNPIKWGEQYLGLPICSPEKIKKTDLKYPPLFLLVPSLSMKLKRNLKNLVMKKVKILQSIFLVQFKMLKYE